MDGDDDVRRARSTSASCRTAAVGTTDASTMAAAESGGGGSAENFADPDDSSVVGFQNGIYSSQYECRGCG